jgi:hypothetical protein
MNLTKKKYIEIPNENMYLLYLKIKKLILEL